MSKLEEHKYSKDKDRPHYHRRYRYQQEDCGRIVLELLSATTEQLHCQAGNIQRCTYGLEFVDLEGGIRNYFPRTKCSAVKVLSPLQPHL